MRSRPRPRASSASIATMVVTSSLRAALIVTREAALMTKSACRRKVERAFALADPAPDRGVTVEVKAALMRKPRIGEQRHIGERDAVADQIPGRGQLVLHPGQRGIAALDLVGIEVGSRFAEIHHLHR